MNHSRWRTIVNFVFIFVFIFLNTLVAVAGPSRTTYQAKIIKPDGYPLESSNVNFKFTILDQSGSCILYAETYSAVNMSATGGLISFALGSGVKTYPASATTFEQVFSNITPNLSCDAGGPPTYSPGANDTRKIVMQFHDGSGWQTLPAMSINAVPYAMYANEAQKLNGKTDADFVQVSTVPTCGVSEALNFNGTSFSCITAGGGGSVTSGTVVAALGYTPADGASFTALNSDLTTTNSNVSAVSSSVNAVSSTVSTLASNLATVSASVFSVSSTVFSVSSTVSLLSSSVSTLTTTVSGISSAVAGLSASMAAIVSSQWVSNGNKIYYNSGYIGIGTSAPTSPLEIASTTTSVAINLQGADTQGAAIRYFTKRGTASETLGSANPSADNFGWSLGSIGSQNAATTRRHNFEASFWNGTAWNIPFVMTASGSVGVGTTNPVTKLDVAGGLRISMESATCAASYAGTLRYNTGTLEFCNGTSWSALGVAGAGITNVNGSTSGSQTFANGTAGTTPAFVTNNGVHTLNIPLASAGSVTAGLLSNADYTTFMGKITSSAASIAQVLGYAPASATALSGYLVRANNLADLTSSATARTNLGVGIIGTLSSVDLGSADVSGTLAIARTPTYVGDVTKAAASNTLILSNTGIVAGTYNKVTVDAKGRVTSSAAMSDTDVITALGYTPASATASTQWTTSGSTIYYNTGNIGVGTAAPAYPLDVSGMVRSTSMATGQILGLAGVRLSGWQGGTTAGYAALIDYNGNARTPTAGVVEGLRVDAAFTPSSGNAQFTGINILSTINQTGGASGITRGIYINPTITAAADYRALETVRGNVIFGSVSGNVGVGTTSPSGTIHTMGSLPIYHDRVGSQAAHLVLRSANGTASSMTARLAGEELGLLTFGGHDGSGYRLNDTGITAVATEAWAGPNNTGSLLQFKTKTNGVAGMASVRMVISSSGAVGIGTSTPSAKLHISAGTSSAAPLKMTSGPLLTSAEAGAIEYDGTNLYFTDGTNSRRLIATTAGAGSIDNASTITSTGDMSLVPVGSVIVSATTASINSNTGALVVKGGLGIAGGLNSSGTIKTSSDIQGSVITATSATVTPYIYGSTVSGGSLRLESTTHSTKGHVLLATGGGYVGIGTSNPTGVFDVRGGDAAANTGGNNINFTAQNAGAGGATGGSINLNPGAGTSGWPGGSVNISTNRGQNGGLSVTNNFTSAYTSSATTAAYPSYNLRVNNGWSANGNTSLILFSATNSTSIQQHAYFGAASVSGASVYGPDLVMGARTGANSYNEFLKIQTSTGNVGIGTTNPASRLHLSDNSAVLATIERQNNQNSLIEYKNTLGSMYSGIISGGSDWGVGTGNDLATSNVFRVANSGRVYVGGTAAPMARLHITAGTSSVAPLKINAGTLLTSPQSGTIEYDGTDYYITDNNLVRRTIAAVNGGTLNNTSTVSSTSDIALWPATGNSVIVSSTTVSTNSNTGALVVKGGLGITGNTYSSGTIVTSSNIQGASLTATSGIVAPYIYGSTASSGDLILDSTTNATKGSVVLAPTGGYVGIGNLNPFFALDVSGTINSAGTQADLTTVSATAFRINQRVHDGASDFGGIGLLSSGANRSDTAIFYGDDNTEALRFVHVRSASPNYNLYEYMRLSPDGKLGLGTNSPSYLMDLFGSASPTLRIRSSSNDASSGPTIRLTEDLIENGGFFRYHSITNSLDLGVIESGVEARSLSINRTTANVGIGTATPSRRLHVLSTGGGGVEIEDTTSPFLQLRRDASNEWYMIAASATNTLEWRPGSSTNPATLALSSAGNVGVGTTTPNATFTVSGSARFFTPGQGDINVTHGGMVSNIKAETGVQLTLGASNTEVIRINNSGNVGIGTSAPTTALQLANSGSAVFTLQDTGATLNNTNISTRIRFADMAGNLVGQVGYSNDQNFKITNNSSTGIMQLITSGTERIRITSAGNVGIGTIAPGYTLDVGGVVNIVSGSSLRFGGTIVCTSAGCTSSSDERLKENIKPLDFSLEKLLSLKAVQYDWKNKAKFGKQHEIGFIAQDLEKVYPQVVRTQQDTGFKSVSYDKLVAPIIEALKVFNKRIMQLFDRTEQNAREIASVKEENAELKARVEKTEKENQELKERLDRIEKALSKSGTK